MPPRRLHAASGALFGQGELRDLDAETLAAALAELPHAAGERPDARRSPTCWSARGLAESRTAARRTVADGGAYLNNQRVADPETAPAEGDLLHGRWLVLRRGKRNLAAVERVRLSGRSVLLAGHDLGLVIGDDLVGDRAAGPRRSGPASS